MQSTASGSVTGTPPADRRWFSRGVPVSPSATRAGLLPAASEAAPGSAGPGDKAMGLAPATVASTAATSKAPSIEEPAQERAGAPPTVLVGSPGGPAVAPPVLGRHGNSRLGPRRGCSFGAAGFLSAEASQRVGRRLIRCSTGLLYEAKAVEPAPPVTPSGAAPSGAAARVPAVPAGAAALALAAGSGLRRGGSGGGLSPAASPMPTGTNRFVAPSPGLRTSGGSGPGPGPAAATTSAAAASPSPGFSARAARGLLSSGMRQSASAGAFNFNRASASDATDDTSVHSAGGNLRSSLSAGNSVISVASGSYVGLGATGPEDAALKLISCTLKASDVKRAPGARQGRVLTAEELGRKLLAEAEGTMTRVLLTRAAGGAAELSPPPPRGKGKGKFPTIAEDAGFSEAGTGPGAESSVVELEFRRAPGCGCVVM
ncbi:hypothetical protein HYH03_011726 [Edaphochlamys debaryana]|uniref:Uncharacterized protein n=1 Tax=Edaphochlamys debaryana TaxID=47281 RepID=A0A836BUU7_9CHLO|nr:hypothetical protein HYH03_011726 [Edaphochlamys debaryana]|eukprot:KAG2489775.1 hypothetical protein HYH03_011726 [Edaphochlamys debaryana]